MDENFILSSNNKTAFLESISGEMPCIDVNSQKGGRFIVNSITDRNNIPKKKRTEGMLCYVKQLKKEYILINDPTTNSTKDTDWKLYSMMEKGFIISFYGREEDVPTGWHICDGTNGTPDLRDRFILGAGNNYKANDTGGSKDNTISIPQLPKHDHEVNGSTKPNDGAIGKFTAMVRPDYPGKYRDGYGIVTAESRSDSKVKSGDHDTDWLTNYSINIAHYHKFSTKTNLVGNGEPVNNMPPYYALFFIMKIE